MYAMYAPYEGTSSKALPVKMFDAAAQGVPSVVNHDCLMGDVAVEEGLNDGLGAMRTPSARPFCGSRKPLSNWVQPASENVNDGWKP